MLFNQMKTIKEKVKYLLITYPHLRGNDFRLIATYYKFLIGEQDLRRLSGLGFLQKFADGKLPHSESIRRVRQKIQEQDVELRGSNYSVRQGAGIVITNEVHKL